MSQGILIAGYYRSGTSALSGALNLAGVDIAGSNERNEHNPRGYFENPVLAKLDIELFNKLDMDWHDIRLMPHEWQQRPDVGATTQRIITELKKHHEHSKLWAVKHPHLCRLMPIYAEAVKRLSGHAPHVIHIYRDPWVVAHSQQKKNGLSRAHALLLWLGYVLDGERYSRYLNRVVLDYELLVKDTRKALRRVSSALEIEFPHRSNDDLAKMHRFLTPNLRRSRAQGRDSTPEILKRLVKDVWEAVLSGADAAVLDQQRERFTEVCKLLDELGSSQLAVTAALSTGARRQQIVTDQPEQRDAEGSPLRPSERSDIAERQRLLQELEQCTSPPSITVVVAVPAGRVEAAFESAQSIERQWHAPREIYYLCADPNAPQRDGWIQLDSAPGALTQALAEHINQSSTEYVGVIDAGDRIEPDACARLCLAAARHNRPGLLYSDEIVANVNSPWIRYKPDFDIERLRGFHYLGGWLWYNTAFLRTTPLDGALAGCEDFDLALRAHEANQPVYHLPEALYSRAPDSHRDKIAAPAVREHARTALQAHLSRCAVQNAEVHDGALPGSFLIRQQPVQDKPISLVLLCDDANGRHCADLEPRHLAKVIESLNLDHLVCATTENNGSAVCSALENLAQHNPAPQQLHVISDAKNEREMLARVAAYSGHGALVFLSLSATTSDGTWLGHLQGKLYGHERPVGMIGTAASYPAQDNTQRLLGPLLLGGNEGVGLIGAGREAGDPGPGGWLLSPQTVDGVAPPCLAIRGDLFQQLSFDENFSGAHLWLHLSMQIRQHGYQVLWDPTTHFQCHRPPAHIHHVNGQKPLEDARLRQRWGSRSSYHHPMLALGGDNLAPMSATGLCSAAPRPAAYALLSGAVEGAEYAVECLRAARLKAELTAGWANEPIAITELRRLKPDAWLRVNPQTPVNAQDAPPWMALYTRMPSQDIPLQTIGEQASDSYATSPALVKALKTHAHHRLQPTLVLPRLPARLWRNFGGGAASGRHQTRLLWIDEGDAPSWIVELMNTVQDAQWFVVEGNERHYDGPIATFKRPADETGWFELFHEVAPHLLLRPAHDATWMDCQITLRGAASGAAILSDARLHCPEEIAATRLAPRYDDWRRALERIKDEPEMLAEHGHHARAGIERLGWLEDEESTRMLLLPPTPGKILQVG